MDDLVEKVMITCLKCSHEIGKLNRIQFYKKQTDAMIFREKDAKKLNSLIETGLKLMEDESIIREKLLNLNSFTALLFKEAFIDEVSKLNRPDITNIISFLKDVDIEVKPDNKITIYVEKLNTDNGYYNDIKSAICKSFEGVFTVEIEQR